MDLFQTHHKGETMGERRSKCKCGKIMVWNDGYNRDSNDKVICKHCKTEYVVESDDITIFWLEEKVKEECKKPYKTGLMY